MISIIICSRKADISEELKQNIAQTIGCEYEVCVIDNSSNDYSIFTAYNEGVRRAKGDILCFMHDDVLFNTNEWGKTVTSTFISNPEYGLLGLGGSQMLPKIPTPWCSTLFTVSTMHSDSIPAISSTFVNINRSIVPVVAVDGVWMCMPRKVFEKVSFDAQTYEGFHMYDIDTCLQVIHQGYKVGVLTSIDMYHPSSGTYNRQWFDNMKKCWKKWQHLLPISVIDNPMITEETLRYFDHVYEEMYYLREEAYKKEQISSSEAYKLGKALLKPLKVLKKK